MKRLYEQIRAHIENVNEADKAKANQNRKGMEFQPGGPCLVAPQEERFPTRRKSKLMARGAVPFKVLAKVGANAYKLELPGDMAVLATFDAGDLSPYIKDEIDFRDLRANLLKGGEDNEDQESVQDPHPEPDKGLLFSHQQGLFCEAKQLSLEATWGRSLLCWTP